MKRMNFVETLGEIKEKGNEWIKESLDNKLNKDIHFPKAYLNVFSRISSPSL